MIDDYSVMCSGTEHTWVAICATVVIIVFIVGVPAGLALTLLLELRKSDAEIEQNRWIVNRLAEEASVPVEDAYEVLRTTSLVHTAAFTSSFKSRFFVWEPLDMLRKLLICGAIVFAGPGSTAQTVLAIVLSFAFFAAHVHCWPCKQQVDNVLRALCEAHIFLACVVALALKSDLSEGHGEDFYGSLLVVSLVIGVLVPAALCCYEKARAVREAVRQEEGTDLSGSISVPLPQKSRAFRVHALGLGDPNGVLLDLVDTLRAEYSDYCMTTHLSSEIVGDDDGEDSCSTAANPYNIDGGFYEASMPEPERRLQHFIPTSFMYEPSSSATPSVDGTEVGPSRPLSPLPRRLHVPNPLNKSLYLATHLT